MTSIDQKLASLSINLPTPSQAVANYVPYAVVENMVVISGQLPMKDGEVAFKGKVGQDLSLEEGQAAARQCAINILAHLKVACGGDLGRVKRCVRLGGFVNCGPDYTDQPKVINGASDLMVDVFGDSGRHARAAVGVNALPLGAAVEVEATFLIIEP
ncbi:MAG: endoribonuclease [Alphaproteobacteria bacterium]|jgi:enamine deaminase RidA (YjgF/YER057c/UK114 family)|nr:endoribonuclease [Alphaproteobacteria bacterium]MDF3034553.1 endoribonuclease [Alphaproteobacteria bacterium]